jgi:hypothetical protein
MQETSITYPKIVFLASPLMPSLLKCSRDQLKFFSHYFVDKLEILICFKKVYLARHWWLTTVILATQEAEIRRITVQSQPWQIVCKTLSRKNPSQKKGW